MGLTNQNSELKFRLQAMEQQAQLRDGTRFAFYPSFIGLCWKCFYIFLLGIWQLLFLILVTFLALLFAALSEKLNEEVQRLKQVIGEPSRRQSGGSSSSESNVSKTSLNPEMFQQLSISQLQHQQHSNQKSKHSSDE